MNLFRLHDCLIVTLDDGTQFVNENCDEEFYKKVLDNLDDKEALISLFNPNYHRNKLLVEGIANSKVISQVGNSLYIKSISELTLPQDFAEKILEAESNNEEDKLTAYLNFWTLLSLNPDSRVRNNLFWFLNRWGMTISKSGLVVGYRNVDIKTEGTQFSPALTKFVSQNYMLKSNTNSKEDLMKLYVSVDQYENFILVTEHEMTEELSILGNLYDLYNTIIKNNDELSTTFTDHHSHTFRIKLGHIVKMDRKKCDSVQEHTCSTGLHIGGKDWLRQCYFGEIGLKCLVNPADVVGIPPLDDYGKMRVCAYYPISIINYDEDGHVVDDGIDTGFEDDFIGQICYQGKINNEDVDNYQLVIPEINEIDKEKIYKNLRDIASHITRRV